MDTLEQDKEEEGDGYKCNGDNDKNNNDDDDKDSLPIVEFTNTNRMEPRGINGYISNICIHAMAGDATEEGNSLNNNDENVLVQGN